MSGQKPDPTGAKILDGALRVLADFGLKRATVELVAKYAGVSHMTIYRRWPSKNDLLKAAIIGGFSTILDEAFDQPVENNSFSERALTAFTDTVWAVQSHPVVLRELNTDTGEQLPMLSSTAGAVMEATVPLVAEQLHRVGATTEDTPADLDPVADVFVRLAYSLVTVKSPGHPLTTRAEVAEYASECFGPYLKAVTGQADLPAADAAVVDLGQRRAVRTRTHRPHLQIAAASVVSVLILGAGLTAVLGSKVELPFVNISKPTTETPVPSVPAINVPPNPALDRPAQDSPDGARTTSGPQNPDLPPPEPSPGPLTAPSADSRSAVPTPVPQFGSGQRSIATGDSVFGGNSGDDGQPTPANPVPNLASPPGPGPGPKPPGPEPQPPGPGPHQPGAGPHPSGPGPQPSAPGPKPPAPGPKPPGPGPKPPGPGPQQSGPGHQANPKPGPSS